ncbi:hypothetical protein ACFVY1_41960 [Streptomyces sp. NPDC058293]
MFGTTSVAPMALVMGAFLVLTTVGAALCRRQSAAVAPAAQ